MIDIFLGYDFKEWSEIIRNFVLCAAAIFTAWVAWQSLNAWKTQKMWEENRELSKPMLAILNRLINFVPSVRSPDFQRSVQKTLRNSSERPGGGGVPSHQDDFASDQYETLAVQIDKFNDLCVEAAAVWYADEAKTLSDLQVMLFEMKLRIRMYKVDKFDLERSPNDGNLKQRVKAFENWFLLNQLIRQSKIFLKKLRQ